MSTTSSIINESTKSCGLCTEKEKRDRYVDNIVGNKYGRLTVLERDYTIKDKRSRWICKCDCGKITSVLGKDLKKGKILSCGCIQSKGENIISDYLDSIEIEYARQKRFNSCIDKAVLPFDFYIEKYNLCIEYDGKQHFEPVDFAGKGIEWAKESHKITRSHDKIKTRYCEDNGINLIRINKKTICDIDKILNIRSLEKLHEEAS